MIGEEVIKHYDTGFNFNKNLSFGEWNLKLINLGTRTKFYLSVYGVGFYDNDSLYKNITLDNYDEAYNLKYSKCLLLQFYRNVNSKEMVESIDVDISERNLNNDVNVILDLIKLKILTNNIDEIKYKDVIHIFWDDEMLCIYYNEKLLGKLKSKMFTFII